MTELLNASEVFVGRGKDGKAEEIMTVLSWQEQGRHKDAEEDSLVSRIH